MIDKISNGLLVALVCLVVATMVVGAFGIGINIGKQDVENTESYKAGFQDGCRITVQVYWPYYLETLNKYIEDFE